MPDLVGVPILDELAPDGFFYGGHYIVEFDPDSLWYETSLTITALALQRGTKTEYHVFQHFPAEALEGLAGLGIDTEKSQKEGLLKVIDSYTDTLKYENAKKQKKGASDPFVTSKPLDAVGAAKGWTEAARAGYADDRKRWLHIDDNTSIFLQYNDEKTLIDNWRIGLLPYAIRARETPHFLAWVRGIASEEFYHKFEALCDGVIDVKAQEEGGRINNYIRVRMLRGKQFDSRWHRLELANNGEVKLLGVSSDGERRRLAAIMFTDLVGYTSLSQRDEALALELLAKHRGLVRPIFERHNGREVKTMGDGFLVEFPSALEAVRCAYDIQRAIREFNTPLPEQGKIHLRVGVHLGDVTESGGDISGDAVNVASRIESLATDGGVCLTRQVHDEVVGKFELPLTSLGPKTLKNVSKPIDVYKIQMPWDQST